MKPARYSLVPALLSGLVSLSVLAAEPADEFSRANCFNNESITYNFFDPPQWRGVVSTHFDKNNGYANHFITPNPLAFCDFTGCYYEYTMATRHAGIHNTEDGISIPFLSNRWLVNGYHTTLFPGVGYTERFTAAENCNLHLDQFY